MDPFDELWELQKKTLPSQKEGVDYYLPNIPYLFFQGKTPSRVYFFPPDIIKSKKNIPPSIESKLIETEPLIGAFPIYSLIPTSEESCKKISSLFYATSPPFIQLQVLSTQGKLRMNAKSFILPNSIQNYEDMKEVLDIYHLPEITQKGVISSPSFVFADVPKKIDMNLISSLSIPSTLWYLSVSKTAPKNVCLPVDTSVSEKNIKLMDSNHISIYIEKNNTIGRITITEGYQKNFSYCMVSQDIDYIFAILRLEKVADKTSHATVLCFDKIKRKIEWFDPANSYPKKAHIPFLRAVCDLLGVPQEIYQWKLKLEKSSCPNIPFQVKKELQLGKGFCSIWAVWFITVKIQNPFLSSKKLTEKAQKRILENHPDFTDYIASLSTFISEKAKHVKIPSPKKCFSLPDNESLKDDVVILSIEYIDSRYRPGLVFIGTMEVYANKNTFEKFRKLLEKKNIKKISGQRIFELNGRSDLRIVKRILDENFIF